MIERWYDLWGISCYLFWMNVWDILLCPDRASAYIFIFRDIAIVEVFRVRRSMNPIRRMISNHYVQCYTLLHRESRRILIRLQTFKEPGPIDLPSYMI